MTDKTTPLIRLADASDAALLAELGARTFTETFAADNRPEDMAAYLASAFTEARLAEELSDPRATFLIAEIEGRAGAYAKLHAGDAPACVTPDRPIELARLYAAREWLGRGVGEALMRACVEEAQRGAYRTVWLGVWERNWRAQAFYRRWGFREVGSHVFMLGEDVQTDLLMERALDGVDDAL
ncbi:MAG TPA: N-acetyltransferase [Pyrinomonadaceae bacterium]|nr:N-acetyltransferase [Pyrinomonadaceae bacterium]